jgi:sirohydrochlorin cobaltochelatase
MSESYSDAAVVLVGHGSTANEDSGAPVFQQAQELRRRRVFADVREAFWKQEPRVTQVMVDLKVNRVFLVPLFISEGYFSEQVIPKALGFLGQEPERMQRRGSQTWFYCRCVGTHPRMTEVLGARARQVLAAFPFPRAPHPKDVTLFIAGHGTQQNENSRVAVERQAQLIRAKNLYADVHPVFLEEEPGIGACYELARTRYLVVVPFFISDGLHARVDIPVLLGEPQDVVTERMKRGQATWRNPTEKHGKLLWYAPGIGTDPALGEVILERVQEAAEWSGSLSSSLAGV